MSSEKYEKLAVDLYNGFQYQGIAFWGTSESLKLAGIVTTESQEAGLKRGVGQIAYSFDAAGHAITKTERNLAHLYREHEPSSQQLLQAVDALTFRYYWHDELQDKYIWIDEWNHDIGLPLAVKVTVTVVTDGKPYTYSKTIPIPSQS